MTGARSRWASARTSSCSTGRRRASPTASATTRWRSSSSAARSPTCATTPRQRGSAVMTRTARIPAMANAHSHAFQLDLRGAGERLESPAMTSGAGAPRCTAWPRATPRRRWARSAAASTVRWRRAGYGAVGEFHYVHHQPDGTPYPEPNAMAIALAQAARAAGLEITLLPAAYHRGGWAGSDSRPRPGRCASATRRWRRSWRGVDALREWAAGVEGVSVGVAAHSVRAVPADVAGGDRPLRRRARPRPPRPRLRAAARAGRVRGRARLLADRAAGADRLPRAAHQRRPRHPRLRARRRAAGRV